MTPSGLVPSLNAVNAESDGVGEEHGVRTGSTAVRCVLIV